MDSDFIPAIGAEKKAVAPVTNVVAVRLRRFTLQAVSYSIEEIGVIREIVAAVAIGAIGSIIPERKSARLNP